MKYNPILNTDSYKFSHYLFYPEGLKKVFSYAESRGGKYNATIFYGLTGFIKKYLTKQIKMKHINKAEKFAKKHGVPFNREGWEYILYQHNGYLPIEIRAVKEGTLIPVKNAFCTVVNTDDECAWLTSYIETALLRIWYPITVATRIFEMKRKIKPYFDKTSDGGNMDFAMLDFSARGCSSKETSDIGTSAFLMMFMGSDSVAAIDYTNKLYDIEMSGFSIPATEHSIMTAYGHANEFASFVRILQQTPDGGTVSVVSDTWDIFHATELWAKCAEEIKRRNITLVVRPDSGTAEDILPKVFKILEEGFGYTTNDKGFKVLNNVRVLWGDGINEDTCHVPFDIAMGLGISSDSILVGSGGGLMQANIDRDTCKFAFKASAVQKADGTWEGVAKDPITDPGKKSKMGILDLVKDGNNKYKTINLITHMFVDASQSELVTYYNNGKIIHKDTYEEIRDRINAYLI